MTEANFINFRDEPILTQKPLDSTKRNQIKVFYLCFLVGSDKWEYQNSQSNEKCAYWQFLSEDSKIATNPFFFFQQLCNRINSIKEPFSVLYLHKIPLFRNDMLSMIKF